MAARLVHMVDTSITELTSRFINELNTRGETPLHWACRYGRFEVVRVLALWKPDYLLRNKKGLSAIALSWLRFDDDIVEFLRPLALYAGKPESQTWISGKHLIIYADIAIKVTRTCLHRPTEHPAHLYTATGSSTQRWVLHKATISVSMGDGYVVGRHKQIKEDGIYYIT